MTAVSSSERDPFAETVSNFCIFDFPFVVLAFRLSLAVVALAKLAGRSEVHCAIRLAVTKKVVAPR